MIRWVSPQSVPLVGWRPGGALSLAASCQLPAVFGACRSVSVPNPRRNDVVHARGVRNGGPAEVVSFGVTIGGLTTASAPSQPLSHFTTHPSLCALTSLPIHTPHFTVAVSSLSHRSFRLVVLCPPTVYRQLHITRTVLVWDASDPATLSSYARVAEPVCLLVPTDIAPSSQNRQRRLSPFKAVATFTSHTAPSQHTRCIPRLPTPNELRPAVETGRLRLHHNKWTRS